MPSILTVGSDPELFLIDSKGSFKSAIGVVPGTKQEPFKVKHGSVQHDNVAAELGIIPSRTASTFSKNIGACIGDLVHIISEKGLSYARMASGIFPISELNTPEAQEFGCDRDYDAYDQSNPCVVDKDAVPYGFRTAGGHVHIGHEIAKSYPEICILACDLYLGLPSVLLDKDVQRRMLYGKASRYRIQPWGVEYRTLSNFWIFTDQYKQWVFKQVEKVVANPSIVFELDTVVPISEIRDIINQSQRKYAGDAIRELTAAGIDFNIPVNPTTEAFLRKANAPLRQRERIDLNDIFVDIHDVPEFRNPDDIDEPDEEVQP